ncbi:MAG: hypothetical protein WCP55_19035 [Lentisphaerota bacterium]
MTFYCEDNKFFFPPPNVSTFYSTVAQQNAAVWWKLLYPYYSGKNDTTWMIGGTAITQICPTGLADGDSRAYLLNSDAFHYKLDWKNIPANYWLLIDGKADYIGDWAGGYDVPDNAQLRHSRMANVLYPDMHVSPEGISDINNNLFYFKSNNYITKIP